MKNKKKKIFLVFITIFMVTVIFAIAYYYISPYYKTIYTPKIVSNSYISEDEKDLYEFIKNNMMNEEGAVYTNLIDQKSDGDITKGHTILSESEGLMLFYYLKSDNREKFDGTLDFIESNMILNSDLISWRISEDEKADNSATIDDFRVVKALLSASEKWNDKKYRKYAFKISDGIYKNIVDKNVITDFNKGTEKSETTTLCYLDISTLNMLSNLNYNKWKKIYDKSLQIIDNGYVSDELPLYNKSYTRDDNEYHNDNDENIDTLLSMIIIYNRLEAGENIDRSLEWIKEKFKDDKAVYCTYSRDTGKHSSEFESTSIYAMIVQIARLKGETELEDKAGKKMKSYQIRNKESIVYGGFGNEDGKNVYSYDNLNALIGYRYYNEVK
ncbi:glycosyl hydrolase family 8 [Clostridium sp. BJN0001]|uniref:glycosyl hydrolase family 8 n=1 Tax=Clostridium sp. BJN0001 TaxID=2930219 RepID=UPI001FD29063|nr:glycosyl hydrolase family 8 [Clostridium sp. BJN0001]